MLEDFSSRARRRRDQRLSPPPMRDIEALLRASGHIEDLRTAIEHRRDAARPDDPALARARSFFAAADHFATVARTQVDARGADGRQCTLLPAFVQHDVEQLLRLAAEYATFCQAALVDPSYQGEALPIRLPLSRGIPGGSDRDYTSGLIEAADRLGYRVDTAVEGMDPATEDGLRRRMDAELARAHALVGTARQAAYPEMRVREPDGGALRYADLMLRNALRLYVWLAQAALIPRLLGFPPRLESVEVPSIAPGNGTDSAHTHRLPGMRRPFGALQSPMAALLRTLRLGPGVPSE